MPQLEEYKQKRDFKKSPEPIKRSISRKKNKNLSFVVQEHHASHLHYDFRLEWNGVLKSWAVPKGPSLDSKEKRLAIEVEDHPLEYAKFQGTIPENQYGAGEVFLWDKGIWIPEGSIAKGLKDGRLVFTLKGKKLHGSWLLLRISRKQEDKKNTWLLMKRKDQYRKSEFNNNIITIKKAVPKFIEPQLARLVSKPPEGFDWVHEIKFDGYRIQAHSIKKSVHLITRSGLDWSSKYPSIALSLKKLPEGTIIDGEVVWQNAKGVSNFQELQDAFLTNNESNIHYWVFDILFLEGKDLRDLSLMVRREYLTRLMKKLNEKNIHLSEAFRGGGKDFMAEACKKGLEGIVSKHVDANYHSGRHGEWVKSKCTLRQEFVVGGFTDPSGSRQGFGSLLLGVHDGNRLRYVGRVGTGFNEDTIKIVSKKIHILERKKSPFSLSSPRSKNIHWIKPNLVAEVSFANWTKDTKLRSAVFHGLRMDKDPTQIIKEDATVNSISTTINLSHPDRIIFSKEKISKQDVFYYYKAVSRWILPYLSSRPLSLLRCPTNTGGKCFFQKHLTGKIPEAIHSIKEPGNQSAFLGINSEDGLLTFVQRGVLEFHAWNSRENNLEYPDQVVIDFDPDKSIKWDTVKEAAWNLKEILDKLGINSFVKLTGGKGLHVQFPIVPRYHYQDVKNFAQALAMQMTDKNPKLYTSILSKNARKKKIFIDYLRNGYGATAVAPYSLRAHSISSVAMPIDWSELKSLPSSSFYTMKEAVQFLEKRKNDPWKNYFSLEQKIHLFKHLH